MSTKDQGPPERRRKVSVSFLSPIRKQRVPQHKAKEAHAKAQSALDKAGKKNVMHRNKVARKKRQLATAAKKSGHNIAGSSAKKTASAAKTTAKKASAKKPTAKKAPAKKPAAKKTAKK